MLLAIFYSSDTFLAGLNVANYTADFYQVECTVRIAGPYLDGALNWSCGSPFTELAKFLRRIPF